MILINKLMKKDLVTSGPNETVSAVSKRMSEKKMGAILVIENGHLVSIFTERDLLNRVVALGRDPNSTLIKEVATPNPICVKESTRVKECAEILNSQNFRHIPVINDEGTAIGIISSRDFFQYMTEELERLIFRFRSSGEKIEDNFDPYEYFGAGGFGLPRD